MEDLVSVIIPAYNAEKYVLRCIKSLQEQTYSNLEILLVDDGSTDNTYKLIHEVSAIDHRIVAFHIDNHGVSYARNYGIEKARGKWITFVDADDFVAKDMIQIAVHYQKKYACDTCCWNGFYVEDSASIKMPDILPEEKVYQGSDINKLIAGLYCESCDGYYGDYFRAVWGKLFSAELLIKSNIRFAEDIKIGEDAIFLIDYFVVARKVLLINRSLYYYELLQSSATGKYKENFEEYCIAEFTNVQERFEKYGLDITNIGISFWHTAEKNLIANELKTNKNLREIAGSVRKLLKYNSAQKYLKMVGQTDSAGTRIRAIMIRCKQYYLVGIIDAWLAFRRKSILQ